MYSISLYLLLYQYQSGIKVTNHIIRDKFNKLIKNGGHITSFRSQNLGYQHFTARGIHLNLCGKRSLAQ